MPNWCSSYVRIKASGKSLDVLESEIEKATDGRYPETDFGNEWLGNLLLHIGMSRDDVIYGDINCRGYIVDWIKNADEITMDIESAWSPHVKCIKEFCDYFVKDADVFYTAFEPGSEIFLSNDPDYIGTVYIDISDGGDMPEDLLNIIPEGDTELPKDKVRILLEGYLKHSGTFEKLAREIEEQFYDTDSFIAFHVYESCDIEDAN